jgi:hypothetical protein
MWDLAADEACGKWEEENEESWEETEVWGKTNEVRGKHQDRFYGDGLGGREVNGKSCYCVEWRITIGVGISSLLPWCWLATKYVMHTCQDKVLCVTHLNRCHVVILRITRFLDCVLRPEFYIQENTTFRELALFPPSSEGRKAPTSLVPLEGANLNHWTWRLALSKGPKIEGAPLAHKRMETDPAS